MRKRVIVWVGLSLFCTGPTAAASCGNTGAGFGPWLQNFRQMALANGISPPTLAAALNDIGYDSKVVRLDRNQKAFKVSYETFVAQRVTPRIGKAKAQMKRHAVLLAGIEKRFGVPKELIVAIWGMETDFGANSGRMNVFRSLATLAYDCRRSTFFSEELMSALTIADRSWLSVGEMRGAWAGELGQTQFLASRYLRFAVDYDGDGRRDLIRSVPDVLASTANYLKGYGWQAGGGFNQGALSEWNKSDKYVRALGYFAERLRGG